MSTLVLIIADQGGHYYPRDEETAKRLFGDLIEQTEATNILALRADSLNEIPQGISELAQRLDIGCECVQVDRLSPDSWTNEDPEEIWSDNLETLVANSSISSSSGGELSFMIHSGTGFGAGVLYSLHEMLGGSLWVTVGGVDRDNTAIRVERNIPDVGSASEAVLTGIARFNIENSGSAPTSSELQGLIDGIPAGKGIENTLRKYHDYFEDKEVVRARIQSDLEKAIGKWEELKPDAAKSLRAAKKDGDEKGKRHWKDVIKINERRIMDIKKALKRVEWNLNSMGRYNANLTLAQQWSGLAVKGGSRGLVIFVRSVGDYSKNVSQYLQDYAIKFDKYAFVVGGIDVSEPIEVSEEVHRLASQQLGNSRVVSLPEESFFSINPNGDLLADSSHVMEILHSVRNRNDAVEWSIDITGLIGLLRPSVFQYAHLAGLSISYMSKNPQEKGDNGIYVSGQTLSKHLLKLPRKSDITAIKATLNDEKLACFVATFYQFYNENPNSVMGIEKLDFGDNRPYHYNRQNFPTDHPLRMNEITDRTNRNKRMNDRLDKAIDYGLAYRDGKKMRDIRLTPAGILAGALLISK